MKGANKANMSHPNKNWDARLSPFAYSSFGSLPGLPF